MIWETLEEKIYEGVKDDITAEEKEYRQFWRGRRSKTWKVEKDIIEQFADEKYEEDDITQKENADECTL